MTATKSSETGIDTQFINGTVAIYVDNTYLFNLTVVDGSAVFPTVLLMNAGKHNMVATYAGETTEYIVIGPCVSNTVEFTINKIPLPLSVFSNASVIHVSEDVNILVSSSNVYDGNIRYIVGNIDNVAQYYNGFNFTMNFNKSGTVNVLVYAEGDSNYLPNSAYCSFNVIKNDIKLSFVNITGIYLDSIDVGDIAIIKVKLSESDATGNVIINIADKDYVAIIDEGYATVVVPNLTSNNLLSWAQIVIATYGGDDKYNPATMISAVLPINKINIDLIKLTPVSQNIFVGEDAVFSINITPTKYTVNGFVTVRVDGKNYNVSIVDGLGSLVVHGLTNGTYNADISYAGDIQFNSKVNSSAAHVFVYKVDIRNIREAYINGVSIQIKDSRKRVVCFKPQ